MVNAELPRCPECQWPLGEDPATGCVEGHCSQVPIPTATAALAENEFFIWSNQHRLWWRPNGNGYSADIRCAGRYTRDEALQISFKAGRDWEHPMDVPAEIAVPVSCVPPKFFTLQQKVNP